MYVANSPSLSCSLFFPGSCTPSCLFVCLLDCLKFAFAKSLGYASIGPCASIAGNRIGVSASFKFWEGELKIILHVCITVYYKRHYYDEILYLISFVISRHSMNAAAVGPTLVLERTEWIQYECEYLFWSAHFVRTLHHRVLLLQFTTRLCNRLLCSDNKNEDSFLFIQIGRRCNLLRRTRDSYVLVLFDPNEDTFAFTDRPKTLKFSLPTIDL